MSSSSGKNEICEKAVNYALKSILSDAYGIAGKKNNYEKLTIPTIHVGDLIIILIRGLIS